MKAFIIISFIFLQSCSPFGNSSVIEKIGTDLLDFFDSKTTTVDFGSGGYQSAITPGNYKVTYSFGSVTQSPVEQTSAGYTIMSNIKTKTTNE